MKRSFYLDFEFIEGFRRWIWWLPSWLWFNKPYWHIEMISIGIWRDDGEGYYAINKNFNPRWANEWVKKNVIAKLPSRYSEPEFTEPDHGDDMGHVMYTPPNKLYKTLKEIKDDVLMFIGADTEQFRVEDGPNQRWEYKWFVPDGLKLYGWYSDYDWVLFCTLFGTMMDLPAGMPMYCIDLKQMLDQKLDDNNWMTMLTNPGTSLEDNRPATLKEKLDYIKTLSSYPKQQNEHCASDDAFFNFMLHQFIMNNKL